MKMVDLRSDTITRPTPLMLEAMMNAKVGDDVFREDPTVNDLEAKTASIFGMEAGLFCPSGTMTNQIAIKCLTSSPGALICDEKSHIYQYEGGGIATNSGVSVTLLRGEMGILNSELIESAIHPDDVHKPETQLISLENTCNKGGGSIYSMENLHSISSFSRKKDLKLHLDGARVFNAIVEKDQDAKEYGKLFDSISVCLSKGLGAPVGSVLVGNNDLIKKARRIRKVFGGGMRQAGYLAAAGIYALDNHFERLKDDHALAKELGHMLKGLSFVEGLMPIETNIVVFELSSTISPDSFLLKLKENGLLAVPFGGQFIRFVTHLDVNSDDLESIESALKAV